MQLGGRIVIRHDPRALASAEWNASNRIVDSVSGISTQKQVPLLAGTYFVKAEDFLGVRSETETAFEVSLPQPDARFTAKTYAEHNLSTPFNGTKTNGVVSGNLDLVPDPYVALGYADNLYLLVTEGLNTSSKTPLILAARLISSFAGASLAVRLRQQRSVRFAVWVV